MSRSMLSQPPRSTEEAVGLEVVRSYHRRPWHSHVMTPFVGFCAPSSGAQSPLRSILNIDCGVPEHSDTEEAPLVDISKAHTRRPTLRAIHPMTETSR